MLIVCIILYEADAAAPQTSLAWPARDVPRVATAIAVGESCTPAAAVEDVVASPTPLRGLAFLAESLLAVVVGLSVNHQ